MWKNWLHLFAVISRTCCTYWKSVANMYFNHKHLLAHSQFRLWEKWNGSSDVGVGRDDSGKKSKNNNLFEARNGTKKNPISATTVTRFISLLSYSTCECLIYSEKYAEQKKNCVCVFVHAELMLSSTSQGFLFLILFFPKLYIFRAAFVRLIFILLLSVHGANFTMLQIPDDDSVQVNAYRY